MNRPPLILSLGLADARLSDPAWATPMLRLADRARIDLLLLGDGGVPPFDPLVVAAWLAPAAGGIGLIPTVNTGRDLPFHVARALSALDFLTGGASGWQPATMALPASADNVPRGADFIAATRSLWDSWDADALIIDADSGCYLDSAKVRRNDHRGEYFRVLGPLNAARPPQGHPVLVQGAADPLCPYAAADIVIVERAETGSAAGAKTLLRLTEPTEVTRIEALHADGAIDGIHLAPLRPDHDLRHFIDAVLPGLADRGLISPSRPPGTLRERLGLAAAPHGFHPPVAD